MIAEENINHTFNYLSIIVGFLLGIISSIFLKRIENFFSKKEIKKGILTELNEFQLRIIAYCLDYLEIFRYYTRVV
jgi:Na+-driven multidrug efflux pump